MPDPIVPPTRNQGPLVEPETSYLGLFLKSHFQEDQLTDCRVESDEKVFHVHRSVLCSKSPVFLAALTTEGMKETESACVVIADFPSNAVRTFLTALYDPSSVSRYASNIK